MSLPDGPYLRTTTDSVGYYARAVIQAIEEEVASFVPSDEGLDDIWMFELNLQKYLDAFRRMYLGPKNDGCETISYRVWADATQRECLDGDLQ